MTQTDAIAVIKNQTPDCSREEIRRAWQSLVDSGKVWEMGRWYSEMASCMIEAGTIERNVA